MSLAAFRAQRATWIHSNRLMDIPRERKFLSMLTLTKERSARARARKDTRASNRGECKRACVRAVDGGTSD